MADNKSQIKSGVLLSYLNMALGMLIPFFYTPVMLRMLGQEEYGLFSLSTSVVAYLSLLSFGFGTTIIRYIAKYRAEEDMDSLRRLYGFFIMLYCGMAVLVIVCGVVLANNVEPIFHKGLTSDEQIKMRSLILIMTVSSALSFPLSVFTSMVIAYERFIFRNLLNILSTIIGPAANLIALFLGYKSIGMAFAGVAVQLLFLPWNIWYCRSKLQLRPIFCRLPKGFIFEIINVSFFHFLSSIVEMLFWATDKVILGMLASSVAVAIYNIGATFHNMVVNLSSAIASVLMPKITKMVYTKATNKELTDLFIKVGRIEFIIVTLFITGYTVFGRQFISLWVGDSYSEAYAVALITMYPICIPLIQNVGLNIVIARNKHRFRSVLYLIIAIVNVVTTYLTVPIWGIIAAALCSGVSYFIGHGIIMNIYYWKVTGIDIPKFWKTILRMSIVPILMVTGGLIILNYVTINSWLTFLLGVIAYLIVYIILMWFFVMNSYEKSFLQNALSRVKGRFSK